MANVRLGAKAVGSIVKIKVNGAAKDFIIVHQGKPSSVYDDSCNGTWLLMKDIYTTYTFGNNNSYKDSSIHTYLNGTFYNLIDSDIRAAIKQVKIPYLNGTGGGDGSLATGANGLSTKVFLLSGYEVGWTTSDDRNFPKDGTRLAYFGSGSGGNSKRVAYNGSSTAMWWLRSPHTDNYGSVWAVNPEGSYDAGRWNYYSCDVRPALILPSTLFVSNDGTVSTNTAPSTPWNISVPSSIMGGTNISISWAKSSDAESNLAGYKVERSTDGGWSWSRIYQGTATSTTDSIAFGTTSVMYRVKAYDTEGLESGWRTSSRVTVVNNNAPSAPPSIAVPKDVKGGSTLVISWTAASDSDGNLSGYILERSTDGGSAYTQVYKGNALTYTDTITNGWSTVMYRVKAYDTEGLESGYTTSAIRTVRYNVAPAINASSTSLGEKNAPFSFAYTVTDADGDTLTVTEKLDGKTTKTRTGVASGTALTFEQTASAAGFQKILNGNHTITVEVSDGKETVSTSATFTKAVHAASVTLAEPLAVEGDITVAVLQVTGSIPDDAVFKAEVTNNAKDAAPVWQDATTEVKKGVNIVFENKTTTNGAAFNFRVSVERGESGEGGYIEAVSGAFQ
ncbi:DUF6273 domain-containing protein [Faecalibacterium sp. i20-0019-C2]|uniref:DUF6273 domain-containing protein n=1 Tax=unclassified Faecalibacterium TaxID=2646395 RepID=UPI0034B7D15C